MANRVTFFFAKIPGCFTLLIFNGNKRARVTTPAWTPPPDYARYQFECSGVQARVPTPFGDVAEVLKASAKLLAMMPHTGGVG